MRKLKENRYRSVILLLVWFAAAMPQVVSAGARPNILLILTDDTGWNGLSIQADPEIPGSGSSYYQTPNTDKLAREGIRFSMAYSAAPTCSPSRYAIQYGMTPTSIGKFAQANPTQLPATADALISRLKVACPEYRTAHFGKWHMSVPPSQIGYDEDDGTSANLQTKDPTDPKYTFSLARKATDFLETQAQEQTPFFLQVSFYANHLQYNALPQTIEKYRARADRATPYQHNPVWAAMNEDLDTAVGQILDKLDELGIRENTYIIYTSDNGFEDKKDSGKTVSERQFYKAHPLRSHKYMISEGGLRVPFLVSGPGIPAGAHSREPVVGWDIFPTVLDMAGAGDQIPAHVEGGSLLLLCKSGGTGKVRRKDPFFVFRYTKRAGVLDVAIVQEGYKLLREIKTGEEHLWNLWEDLGESNNLLDTMPERAELLRRNLDDYFHRIGWDQQEHMDYKEEWLRKRKAMRDRRESKQ